MPGNWKSVTYFPSKRLRKKENYNDSYGTGIFMCSTERLMDKKV